MCATLFDERHDLPMEQSFRTVRRRCDREADHPVQCRSRPCESISTAFKHQCQRVSIVPLTLLVILGPRGASSAWARRTNPKVKVKRKEKRRLLNCMMNHRYLLIRRSLNFESAVVNRKSRVARRFQKASLVLHAE